MAEAYKVSLPAYEGPMDLLLSLIEKHKIDIYDIPMAVITKEYLAYLAKMAEFDIEPASEFLVLAATLLLIKSRMMLPKKPRQAETTEEDPPDPRQELVDRIIEYRRYKKVTSDLIALAEKAERYVAHPAEDIPFRRVAPTGLDINDLIAAFQLVMRARAEQEEGPVVVAREQYTVEERMGYIVARLAKERALAFSTLFSPLDRDACLTTFLALLELVKTHSVTARQDVKFGEIYIVAREETEKAQGE